MSFTYQIAPGTTDVSVTLRVVDSVTGLPETGVDHATSGIDLKYRRTGSATVDLTETSLAALTTAHTDGGVEQIGAGYIRVDLPDAACATGAAECMVFGSITDMVVIGCVIQLEAAVNKIYSDTTIVYSDTTIITSDTTAMHTQTTAIVSDTTAIHSDTTAIHSDTTSIHSDTTKIDVSATAAASNVLLVYSDTTRIDSNTVLAETNISDIESSLVIIKSDLVVAEALASDNKSSLVIVKSDLVVAEALASDNKSSLVIVKSDTVLLTAPGDGTAGAFPASGILDQGTAQSASATTLVLRSATPFTSDDACLGATLWAHGSTQGYWQARTVTDYTTVDDTCTVDTWDVTPSGTITYKLFGTAPEVASSGALTATQASQLTRIQSDLIIAQSDVIIIGSDLLQVYSDTTAIHTLDTAAAGNISDIESSLVIVKSDLVVHEAIISDNKSSLVIAKSDLVLLTAPGDGTAGAYPALNITDQGTAQGATGTTIVLRSAAVFANDTPIGMTVLAFGSTQGYWQAREITDYTLADDTATVATWTVTPSGTITYKVFGTAPISVGALTATQASQLTRVQSDGIVVQSQVLKVYSDTTAIHTQTSTAETNISDIESSLVKIYSDTTSIHSDTTAIHTLDAAAAGSISDIESSLVIVKSDLVVAEALASDNKSSLVIVKSDLVVAEALASDNKSSLVIVKSDLIVIDDLVSDNKSSLVIVKSDLVVITSDIADVVAAALTSDQNSKLTRIASDVIALEPVVSDIKSSTVIIKSDLVVIEAIASDAKSSLVIARSDLVISNSDTTAIQTKTDSLTFTQAGHVDANVQRVNDVAITGDGSAGDKFDVV